MTVNWDRYVPYKPPYLGPLHEMTRKEARECYQHLMAARPERRSQLDSLLASNGLSLGDDDGSIQQLNNWFRNQITSDPDESNRLGEHWYAVVNDIGLFLGDLAIFRNSGLHWELFTAGKKNVSYQKHVVMGFNKVKYSKFNFDFDDLVARYGHSLIEDGGEGEREDFFVFQLLLAEAMYRTGRPPWE